MARLQPLQAFMRNPAGSAIVNAVTGSIATDVEIAFSLTRSRSDRTASKPVSPQEKKGLSLRKLHQKAGPLSRNKWLRPGRAMKWVPDSGGRTAPGLERKKSDRRRRLHGPNRRQSVGVLVMAGATAAFLAPTYPPIRSKNLELGHTERAGRACVGDAHRIDPTGCRVRAASAQCDAVEMSSGEKMTTPSHERFSQLQHYVFRSGGRSGGRHSSDPCPGRRPRLFRQ